MSLEGKQPTELSKQLEDAIREGMHLRGTARGAGPVNGDLLQTV